MEASGASRCPGAPAVEPIPTSASRYGVSTSTVRAEVSTSQAASPATIRRAVTSQTAVSPGTVRVTAARSTWDPARSSVEAIRSRSRSRGSSTTRPANGVPAALWDCPGGRPAGRLPEADSAMASVPSGLVGVQVDDVSGTVLQQDLRHSDAQRLRRTNRRR